MNSKTLFHDNTRYSIGKNAEDVICDLLIRNKCSILERRYKTKEGEIDIIAQSKNTIIFVEVKARKHVDWSDDIVSKKQWNRIINTSQLFLSNNMQYQGVDIRYDQAVIMNGKILEYFKNVTFDS